jgi:hypothetical protein
MRRPWFHSDVRALREDDQIWIDVRERLSGVPVVRVNAVVMIAGMLPASAIGSNTVSTSPKFKD